MQGKTCLFIHEEDKKDSRNVLETTIISGNYGIQIQQVRVKHRLNFKHNLLDLHCNFGHKALGLAVNTK